MTPAVDLYEALKALLEQVPDDMATTSLELARALGDRHAAPTVTGMLGEEELAQHAQKVVDDPHLGATIFNDFTTDEPLRKLREIQKRVAKKIVTEDSFGELELYAGADASYRGSDATAACVVVDGDLDVRETSFESARVRFPYIPGYLMFREAPVIVGAAEKTSGFDVLIVNGHGVAHPRGCGLASCVGLKLDMPTIGVAGRRLVGDLGPEKDGWTPIISEEKEVSTRISRKGRSSIFVSTGHRISLETSIDIVRKMTLEGRLPEPLRLAHQEARRRSRGNTR
ncbi:MAG: endonuclease V [Candidatus Bathyarchaeota archaeon]|nr:MAG: endonuclease V [Candidatus Bathyarchaeota archaeon]